MSRRNNYTTSRIFEECHKKSFINESKCRTLTWHFHSWNKKMKWEDVFNYKCNTFDNLAEAKTVKNYFINSIQAKSSLSLSLSPETRGFLILSEGIKREHWPKYIKEIYEKLCRSKHAQISITHLTRQVYLLHFETFKIKHTTGKAILH